MIAETIDGTSKDLHSALIANGLPVDDIGNSGLQFFRFSVDGRTVAYGGLEKCARDSLLRSLAVLPQEQGRGFGRKAVAWLLNESRAQGTNSVYLLTTSAADFFKRFGFVMIARDEAPEAIRATEQAASLCPSSATLMTREA